MQAEVNRPAFGFGGVDAINRPVENPGEPGDYRGSKNPEVYSGDFARQWYGPSLGESDLDRDQVQDMIGASEARTDTKFARLEGKLDLLLEETRHTRTETAQELSFVRERLAEGPEEQRSTRNTIFATVIPSAVAVAGLVFALWQGSHDANKQVLAPERPALIYNDTQPQPQPAPKALRASTQNKG